MQDKIEIQYAVKKQNKSHNASAILFACNADMPISRVGYNLHKNLST